MRAEAKILIIIIIINAGSSSVKIASFSDDSSPQQLWSGAVDRIGLSNGCFHIRGPGNSVLIDETRSVADHDEAFDAFFGFLEKRGYGGALRAVGHRVVHGGDECDCPMIVSAALEAHLWRLLPLAPLHLGHNLAGIAAARRARPDLPQVACFDTAFHHSLPRLARLTALPRVFEQKGIRRYGFHGLSYEYILDELGHHDREGVQRERIVIAHLGNGASMAAIHHGRSVETTMGFSALGGLPMGTRCGDLDPGIILHLLSEKEMALEEVEHLLYEESGILGISGISSNMQDLLARQDEGPAAEAIEFFCYQARKHLGALTAAVGGLDRLVFTGGMGANAPAIRAKICQGLECFGIHLDNDRNDHGDREISSGDSEVRVEVVPTNEALMIARHVRRLLCTPVEFQKE
jgi:acetate kinase